jgi:sugar lactone lactonase YvrE
MKNTSIVIMLLVFIGVITVGCASLSDYLVGTPLIGTIINNKEISRIVKEPIVVSGSYEVSYFIPTNHLSTPSDIAISSSGEIFVSEVRGKGISKVSSTGDVSFWANTNSVGSYSIAVDSQDNLYSYFFPSGTIFKITPNGAVSVLFENNSDLQCYTESSITVDPTKNELYIVRNNEATGYATLYKVVNGELITLLDHLKYIWALTFNREGKLFLGMGNEIQELNLNNFSRTIIAGMPENQGVNHHGLAADASGNLFVSARQKLYKLEKDGVFKFLVEGFYDLEGLAVASDNTIYAVDRATCGVCKISESARRAEYLVPPSFISTPQAIEFNSAGKLVITEDETGAFGTYSKDGTFESFIPSIVYQPPLAGLAIDNNDNIYISESAPGFPDRLMLFKKEGGSTVVSTDLQKPAGLAFYNDELYIAEFDAGRVSKINSNGVRETYVSGLTHPEAIDFDPGGNLYVSGGANQLNDAAVYIEKITPDKTITRFASLKGISYMKFDSSNNQLLASVSDGKIYKISQSGDCTTFISGLETPMGIAFDQSGNIYMADDHIDAVYKLAKKP